jgi:hypothetical protein
VVDWWTVLLVGTIDAVMGADWFIVTVRVESELFW